MAKVTDELVEQIKNEMLRVLEDFRLQTEYWAKKGDTEMVAMLDDDIAYNAGNLADFLDDRDVDILSDRIYRQDTAPREEFYKVLNWIEEAE